MLIMLNMEGVNTTFSGTALWSIDEKNQLDTEEYSVTFHTYYKLRKEI